MLFYPTYIDLIYKVFLNFYFSQKKQSIYKSRGKNNRMKQCIKCGQKAELENLCTKCYLEKNPLLTGFKDIRARLCPDCSYYFLKGKWQSYSKMEKAIEETVRNSIKLNKNVEKTKIEIEFVPGRQGKRTSIANALLELSANIEGKTVKDKYEIPVIIAYEQCGKCSSRGGKYFEGVLQIRHATEEILNYIRRDISKTKGVQISKEEEEKDGIDFYLTSQKYMVRLGEKLHKEFGGELKINSRIFTRDNQTSKDVYRMNVFLKFGSFKNKDIIHWDGKIIRISNVSKQVTGFDLSVNKKISVAFDKIKNAEVLEKQRAMVVKTQPDVCVLNPETYDSVKIENKNDDSLKELKNGENVKVVVLNGRVWIV